MLVRKLIYCYRKFCRMNVTRAENGVIPKAPDTRADCNMI